MLEVKNLSLKLQSSKSESFTIVDDITFNINAGEVFALIGESGSGKTLTSLSVMRILPHKIGYSKSSQIIFQGQDLLNITENNMRSIRGAGIAMIFQDPMTSLNPIATIGKQIIEVLRLHRGIKGRLAYIETLRLLEAVKIPDPTRRFYNYPHELSGGMRQRVMIAMALACKPSLLIADEPTTALDVTTQAQILHLLKELQKKENMAILLITHDLAIAAQIADRIAVMQRGKLVEQNSTREFFAAPQNAYSKKLLASVPDNLLAQTSSDQAQTKILEVSNLRVYFPIKQGVLRRTSGYTKAVDDINFALYAGKTLAIVGESGSGKSTVAKAVLALLPEATGKVEFSEHNLLQLANERLRKYRTEIQIVFQDPYTSINPKLRVIDSLEDGLIMQGKLSAAARQQKIDALLEQVGLNPKAKYRYPHEFSGGERQRLCIARALSVDPKIIICDEPTSSLDVSVQAQVLKLLLDVQRDKNISYLFISHDLKVVGMLAHQIAVMQAGKIVEHGATQTILNNPQHPYTQKLLAAVPKIKK
jgi:peptide/nickel transport system ATP-binding protein